MSYRLPRLLGTAQPKGARGQIGLGGLVMHAAHDGRRHATSLDEAVELRLMSVSNAEEQALETEVDGLEEEMRSYDTLLTDSRANEQALNRRTVRKLDFILLPFLALLFLFNSLDKSNIGNAETANFTKDIGIPESSLNTAVAIFFAFFVTLQPVGAAFGRKFGMAVWVPTCMTLWGICTALHIWVRSSWQLIALRIAIGTLEAGFYPTTVSYLSLFYTRYEFARRLSLFYGQAAVAGALGGLVSYAVFSRFSRDGDGAQDVDPTGWKSWQVLFLLEGGTTMVIALIGFLLLPHNVRTAWFLRADEQVWAEERIRRDRDVANIHATPQRKGAEAQRDNAAADDIEQLGPAASEEMHGLLTNGDSVRAMGKAAPNTNVTDDRGLTRADILAAALDWKIWYLLVCNILSAIPVTAFSVFLPLVLHPMTTSPALANLLAAPPFLIGAAVLYSFAYWSDKTRQRLVPILWSLALLLAGLSGVVVIPGSAPAARYAALCVLLSGTFVASPLTVAWLAGNVPEPGKRSVVLGVNGWGNLAGVVSSLLFAPRFRPAYTLPFFVTLACVLASFAGYAGFRAILVAENARRRRVLESWTAEDVEAEHRFGRGPLRGSDWLNRVGARELSRRLARWSGAGEGRKGDERITFEYGL